MSRIERHLHLECKKWDTQVGDEHTLLNQALILPSHEWDFLCSAAEELAAEILRLEFVVIHNPNLLELVGVPKVLQQILMRQRDVDLPPSTRAMRFDFHPTSVGWCVSEVNSDVPGGWSEGTNLPRLYAPFYSGLEIPMSPLAAWLSSMQFSVKTGTVALLCAPGYLEDHHVVLAFAKTLQGVNISCRIIQSPAHLDRSFCAVVRFYQVEWLCNLPASTGWRNLLQNSQIPVTNPTISALSESKRFPLVLAQTSGCAAWKKFMPESRDPREVISSDWDGWVMKASYSNTGDSVYLCDTLTRSERDRLMKSLQREPFKWVAQRRFRTLPLESSVGLLYPCVGVFVVDGRAAGAYVRLSTDQVTDGAAKEAPLLIDRSNAPS